MKRKTCLSLLLSSPLLFLSACGGKVDKETAKTIYSLDFRCRACNHEFAHEWDEIEKMRKSGDVIVPEGELMKVKCPSCGEIEGQDADARSEK